jgi:hypothetical protein
MEDLNEIIADSITDVELGDDPIEDTPIGDEAPAPEVVPDTPAPDATPEVPEAPAVPSPASKDDVKPLDDFEKKYGITALSSSGRENRIPYPRVKKIAEKAVKDAQTTWTKGLEASHVPIAKYQELDTKIKDYEGRLSQVAEFERVMTTDAPRFLQMLTTIPGYTEIFNRMGSQDATPPQQEAPQAPISEAMPEPDQKLSDGSTVYSMDGLKALLAWQARQIEEKVTRQVQERYAPLETDYQTYQRTQAIIPQVQKQIADARTWHLFNENEDEIVKTLQAYPNATLEQAYQHVVVPKLKSAAETATTLGQTERDKMRAELLKELKTAPRATSASVSPARPAATPVSAGPRNLEDVIADAVKGLK